MALPIYNLISGENVLYDVRTFLCIKKGLPLFILPLILFVIVSLFMELIIFFLIIFAGIGAIDFWADFRKLEAAKNDGA